MRNAWLALLGALMTACGLSALGGSAPDDTRAKTDADGAAGDGALVGQDASTSAKPDDATVELDGACDPSTCPGRRCEGGGCATFASCKDLHDNGGALGATNGVYSVGPGGAEYMAYCEMTVAEGGWTLVGQSGSGATTGFGWKSATGTVTDTDGAYSLDAIGHGVPMTEALLVTGRRTSIDAVYQVKLPGGFPNGFENKSAAVASVTKIANAGCTSIATPTMMNFTGYTSLTGQFYFRDVNGNFGSGLVPAHWDLYYTNNCTSAGKFTYQPGMLFVR